MEQKKCRSMVEEYSRRSVGLLSVVVHRLSVVVHRLSVVVVGLTRVLLGALLLEHAQAGMAREKKKKRKNRRTRSCGLAHQK